MPSALSYIMPLNPFKSRTKATAPVLPMSSEGHPFELAPRGEVIATPIQDAEIARLDTASGPPTSVAIPRRSLKLFSAGFSFFVAGTNDGSMGALLPYIIHYYNIGTSFIALMYVNFSLEPQLLRIHIDTKQILCHFLGMASCSYN
jgi:hypothetical protein